MMWLHNHVGIQEPEHIFFECGDCIIGSKGLTPSLILILELNDFGLERPDLRKYQCLFGAIIDNVNGEERRRVCLFFQRSKN